MIFILGIQNSRKEDRDMNALQYIFNWKTILAAGAATSVVILAIKVDPFDAGRTLEAEANAVSNVITGVRELKKR